MGKRRITKKEGKKMSALDQAIKEYKEKIEKWKQEGTHEEEIEAYEFSKENKIAPLWDDDFGFAK